MADLAAGTTGVSRRDATERRATPNAGPQARRIAGIALVAAVLFSFVFDYFGRPPLIVQGLYNQRQIFNGGAGYALGSPQWSLGRVTYPITGQQAGCSCTGSVTFDWSWFGWQEKGAGYTCQP